MYFFGPLKRYSLFYLTATLHYSLLFALFFILYMNHIHVLHNFCHTFGNSFPFPLSDHPPVLTARCHFVLLILLSWEPLVNHTFVGDSAVYSVTKVVALSKRIIEWGKIFLFKHLDMCTRKLKHCTSLYIFRCLCLLQYEKRFLYHNIKNIWKLKIIDN